MRSKGEGLYSCSYTPARPLKHTVAVAWGGVGVPNSPFRVSSQSQHPVTTGRDVRPRSGDLFEAKCATVVEREPLPKTKSARVVVQSEANVSERSIKMAKPKAADARSKSKKPLIIITTYTEKRYNF